MKNKLVAAALVFSGIILSVIIVGMTRPDQYHVERSIEISASAEKIYGIASDLHRFEEWSPWAERDPNMKKSFEGAPSGVGSIYAWEGNKEVGSGRMIISDLKANERVDIKLEFLTPWKSESTTSWQLQKLENGKTKMTWAMEGKNDGLIPKILSMFLNMDSFIGNDFEQGLAKLKKISE